MGKHKKKSSHKKKHKKEKKSRKEKKSKHHSSSSSDSDSSSDLNICKFNEEKKPEGKPNVKKLSSFHDEIMWNDLFSDKHATEKQRNAVRKDRDILDKPGQSARELNPYWKDGGNGLPPTRNECLSEAERNNDVKYLKALLKKAMEVSEATGESLANIVYEEWGPLDKLKQIIEESEKPQDDSCRRRMFQRPSSPSGSGSTSARDERHMSFMKPGEISKYNFTNTYRRNWKKKDSEPAEGRMDTESLNKEEACQEQSESTRILTRDELNALTAKAMKAEIMGNKELSAQLWKEIEIAKRNMEATKASESTKDKREEVVVLTKTNSGGLSRPCDTSEFSKSEGGRKRHRGETHAGNERVRYFLDDDKHDIKTMFEKEKFNNSGQSDEMFLKMAKKGKIPSNSDDNDLDDIFLDRVRGSDYERKESEREKKNTLDKAKAHHKSVSNCRWCLDGTNVQKHLIISVGNKCYLCLPSDESLTTGHCLIVPVHHDTCGTQLDEDVWNEMQMYRKRLCRMFEENGEDVVFFENARSFRRFPHMVLHCVPIEKEVGDLAPIYFKKAIMESETEWSNNKKVIDLKTKDLRRSVPKGLPYFAVDFGMEGGFAHVIEDEKLFPPNFAEEIIGGMLDLDAHKWRKRRRESLEDQKDKVAEFSKRWKKYELSDSSKKPRRKSDSSSSD